MAGLPAGWVKKPVKLTFTAVAGEGSAPVAYTEYRLGSGAWARGDSVLGRAAGRDQRSGTGRSDTVGDVETTRSCTVRIDSVAPKVTDYGRPCHGRVVRLASTSA